jgi:hypothetical protein
MSKTLRVHKPLLANPNVNCVKALFPVPPVMVACPLGFAFRRPLPLEKVKFTKRLLDPTVPGAVSTFVAAFRSTQSVPRLLTPLTAAMSARAGMVAPNMTATKAIASLPALWR